MKEYNIIEVLNSPVGTKFRDKEIIGTDTDVVFTVVQDVNGFKYLIDDFDTVPLNNYIANTVFCKIVSIAPFSETINGMEINATWYAYEK